MYLVTRVDYAGFGSLTMKRPLSSIERSHLNAGGKVAYCISDAEPSHVSAEEINEGGVAIRVPGLTLAGSDKFPLCLLKEHLDGYRNKGWVVVDGSNGFREPMLSSAIEAHKEAYRQSLAERSNERGEEVQMELGLGYALLLIKAIERRVFEYNVSPEDIHLGLSHGAYKGALMVVNTNTHRMVEVSADVPEDGVKLTYGIIRFHRFFKRRWRRHLHSEVIQPDDWVRIADGILTYLDGTLPVPV